MKNILRDNILDNEKKIWNEALFVFDSSAILNFYEYSEVARNQIYSTTFQKLLDRLWITNQTEFEFLKNKQKVLLRPKKLYDELIETHFDLKQFETFKNQFQQLKNRTKKDDKHPHIDLEVYAEFEKQMGTFERDLASFTEELKKQIEKKKAEIESVKQNDTIEQAVYKYFKITPGYSFAKLIEIAKEGEFRYRNTIPPGYEDLKEKTGLQVYGDLIIWKQILDLAIGKQKSIILIIDDLKIDWCLQNTKDKNLIDSPREELIKEIQDVAGVKFWSYSSTQFLQKSKDYFETAIAEEIIQEVNKSNLYNLYEQAEAAVQRWATDNWKEVGDVIKIEERGSVDLLLTIDSFKVGIEIKLYPAGRHQSIKSLVEKLHPRFSARGYFDKFDEILIIVVCENRQHAIETNESKNKYEITTGNQMSVLVGFLNESGEFESL